MSTPLPLEFVTSATKADDLPETPAEVAVVGRSNVGKSSLLNALANRTNLARVSKTPGRTQLLNLFRIGRDPGDPSSGSGSGILGESRRCIHRRGGTRDHRAGGGAGRPVFR